MRDIDLTPTQEALLLAIYDMHRASGDTKERLRHAFSWGALIKRVPNATAADFRYLQEHGLVAPTGAGGERHLSLQ